MPEDSFFFVVTIFLFLLIVLALFSGAATHPAAYYTVAPL
jgi:hypothetical protein